MNTLHLSQNIANFRRQKGLTQEELADFLGVTKASVSKWERNQSLPDILLLPQIATFFDVTIDELLGYKPQLSKEQIKKYYYQFASDFVTQPFEEVIHSCELLVKKYYSCYPFLFQMALLYINHFMLTDSKVRQEEVLQMAFDLCDHIENNCDIIALCNDSIILKANINLIRNNPTQTIEALEDMQSPYHLSNLANSALINAYHMAGEIEKADSFVQINLYSNLISFIQNSTLYMEFHTQESKICNEIINRTCQLIQIFDFENLHPSVAFVFYFKVSLVFCMQNKKEEALHYLTKYIHLLCYSFNTENIRLHSDSYFPLLDTWFDQLILGNELPRDKRIILESAIESLENPLFSIFEGNDRFIMLKQNLVDLYYIK